VFGSRGGECQISLATEFGAGPAEHGRYTPAMLKFGGFPWAAAISGILVGCGGQSLTSDASDANDGGSGGSSSDDATVSTAADSGGSASGGSASGGSAGEGSGGTTVMRVTLRVLAVANPTRSLAM
jgi:hypothetical protein